MVKVEAGYHQPHLRGPIAEIPLRMGWPMDVNGTAAVFPTPFSAAQAGREQKPLPALLAPESCLLPLPGSGRGAEAAWEVAAAAGDGELLCPFLRQPLTARAVTLAACTQAGKATPW